MKKVPLHKVKLPRRKKKANETSSRITNETVAEHRERILAGGRRFKYPHQYVKHRLVINAVLIAVVFAVLISIVGWWQLYKAQNTTEFVYRTTRVLPLPVATVDGEWINYSDYLMRYRSQELWMTTKGKATFNSNSEDSERELNFIKRRVLDELVAVVYAQKRARDLTISVTDVEIQAVIDSERDTATGRISQEVYETNIKYTLGYSPDEYRHIIKQLLLRQKVAYAVDTTAAKARETVAASFGKDSKQTFDKLTEDLKSKGVNVEFGASGLVLKNNHDGGLSRAALKLKDGEVSSAIQSTTGDGYYFVRRLATNDRQVSYEYIKVPLRVFNDEVASLQKDGKVKEYIDIPTVEELQKRG
ncbi:MAG: SurA N-terminal domain-containing protein [Candidatus Saccharimonadales bacterium]